MQQIQLPTHFHDRDRWVVRSLLSLSLMLLLTTYVYRLVVTDQAYDYPVAQARVPLIVQSTSQTQ